jgi:hypothetical protein
MLLFAVFFAMLIVNVVICVANEPAQETKIRALKKLRKIGPS